MRPVCRMLVYWLCFVACMVWVTLLQLVGIYFHILTTMHGQNHIKNSRVSFCDGSFYDDSLLRPLSSRTEHSPTCGASLSQLKHPFSTWCDSRSFPVCMCFFFFYFSAVLLSLL